MRGLFDATVVANVSLCREHYRLTLRAPGLPASAPGQFVQVSCRDPQAGEVDHEFTWSPGDRPHIAGIEFEHHEAFLRRPFSIAGRRGDEIDLIGREVGPGTRFLSRLRVGDIVSLAGPLGNRFILPEPNELALLVGGGVGIPPMIYLAQAIAEINRPDAPRPRVYAFAGALTRGLMPLTVAGEVGKAFGAPSSFDHHMCDTDEFRRFGALTVLTTDDGSLGMKGYVTDALTLFLDAPAERLNGRTTLYTCGPEPMMQRVQQIAALRGIRCQIAVERAMACGMGTCQSCCIKVRKPDPSQPPLEGRDWCYRLACTDGPVFEGTELLW